MSLTKDQRVKFIEDFAIAYMQDLAEEFGDDDMAAQCEVALSGKNSKIRDKVLNTIAVTERDNQKSMANIKFV